MRDNTYQNNAYSRRSQSRYQAPEEPTFVKRLVEEFLTQLTICVVVMGVILGAQLLGNPSINKSITKVKTMITYSPSLNEIAKEAKEGTSAFIQKISSNDKSANNQEIDTKEVPIILVDDEIF